MVRFGAFEVDLRSRELRKCGLRIKLHQQPFRVLELLLEHSSELVTREELQRRIWPDDTFVDFEAGLNTAINRLRKALDDSAETPRFIETLPRRGYRLLFPINGSPPAASAPTASVADQSRVTGADEVSHPEPMSAQFDATQTSRWMSVQVLVLAVIGAAAVYLVMHRRVDATGDIHSLAVLPLENLSADPQQEYFADGVTDEIITDLAKLGTVRVMSRTSVLRYKHAPMPLPEIARELDVDAVAEGTVTRSGKRVRITAQLIRARTGQLLWANDFEGDVQDTLALQDDVARAIANSIQRKLTPDQQVRLSARRPVDPEAYDAYMRGRYIFQQRGTQQSLANAIREFTLAIEKDPNYAPAYAALADCYTRGMNTGRPLPSGEAWARAAEAASKALQLDHELAAANVALATIRFRYDWDWAEADREYKRGIELDPNDAQAYLAYSVFLNLIRRTEEGAAAARKAAQLDPLSANVSIAMAFSYAWAHRYDDAIHEARRTLELDPNYAPAHELLARSYEAKGKWEPAVAEWLKAFTLEGIDNHTEYEFRKAFATAGVRAFWRKWLESDEERLRRGERPRLMELARLSYLIGDKSASFGWLERAYNERDPGLPNVYWAADWIDPSRSDPRYLALVRRMRLPE